ncbi:unnamed protein product [Gongylonema pulchrum]|uniref:Uncharacterized protein n=1 Tax=Gongylonema pulchrum TaxID=637853 RepID=A0A183DC99_9BILA|nr:unnamed protein product [Gongylonema pulchrum]
MYGGATWSINDSNNDRLTLGTCSATSSVSNSGSVTWLNEKAPAITNTTTGDDGSSRTDKILQKVSMAMRRRLTVPKTLANGQHKVGALGDQNHSDSKNNRKLAHNNVNKQAKPKSNRKMIDITDVYPVGRRHRHEHRQLLSEEYDDE